MGTTASKRSKRLLERRKSKASISVGTVMEPSAPPLPEVMIPTAPLLQRPKEQFQPVGGGYPTKYFCVDPQGHLICSICTEVVCSPLNLETCSHMICKSCFDPQLIKVCPQCRAELPVRPLAINVFVQHVVSQLHVRCPYYSECKWSGPLGTDARTAQAHLDTCPFQPFRACESCAMHVHKNDFPVHQRDQCRFRNSRM